MDGYRVWFYGEQNVVLSQLIIGILEDNSGLFVLPQLIGGIAGCTTLIQFPFGICQNFISSSEPFSYDIIFALTKLFGPFAAYNITLIATFALNFSFALKFFKKLFGVFVAFLLSLILSFSPYFAYQGRSHSDLIHFWPIILLFYLLLFYRGAKKPYIVGLTLVLTAGFSNYLGYFSVIFVSIYYFLVLIFSKNVKYSIKLYYRDFIKGFLTFLLLAPLFILPSAISSIFKISQELNSTVLRPLGDFVTFSSRPWYYFMPSTDNPFFGEISSSILTSLEKNSNYFLFQNYFKKEHSASYLGLINLIFALIGLKFLLKHGHRQRREIFFFGLTALFLVVLSMPPFFTINMDKIYMPSYIMWKLFPMFRVLARFGVVILFVELIFTGFGYLAFINYFKSKFSKSTALLFIVPFVLVSLMEFFIPIKLTTVSKIPDVYSYLITNTKADSVIAVYPDNETLDAYFWLPYYNRALINPKGYANYQHGFFPEQFTKELATCEGVVNAYKLGATHLIVFNDTISPQAQTFFEASIILSKVMEFNSATRLEGQTPASKFISIQDISEDKDADIFKIKDGLRIDECSDSRI